MEHKEKGSGIFPCLNDAVGMESSVRLQDVLPSPAQDIERFCRVHGITTLHFIETVWLIVLGPFLDADRVCFGYRDHRDRPPDPTSGPAKVIESDLFPNASVAEMLKTGFCAEPENQSDEQLPAHNTAVALIKEIAGSDRSYLLKEAEQWGYGVVLVGEMNELSALLRLSLVHKTSILSPCLAENLSSTALQVIQEILADHNRCIKDLTLFSPLNRDNVLRWNGGKQQSSAASPIELIHQRACERPHHPAVCAWDGTLSYSQVDSLTTQWASYLQRLGVGPGHMVPVMMNKSQWIIVAELAILKTGGAFVPIDPKEPTDRLRHIITQVKATVALTSTDLVATLSSLVATVVIVSSETTSSLPNAMQDIPSHDITPETTAYVVFTSGSTGQPKGCVMSHRALTTLEYLAPALKITAESRVLQFAPYGFVMSLAEIFCSLVAGATVCIPSKEDCLNNLQLAMESMLVSWAILTPSAAQSLARPLASLKTLVLAGEPISSDLFQMWANEVDLHLVLGCTEWAGVSVSPPLRSPADVRCIGTSPTGRLWLVDPTDHNRLAPVGAVAELVVDSPGLASGYLDDASQTASAFINAPAWFRMMESVTDTGVTLYKTGDLVQYYADGRIRYIGRKNTQVKVRGKRLELGEIEHHIRRISPMIEQVIAEAAAPKGSETPIVVAFLYSPDQEALLLHFQEYVASIKKGLEQALPDHMWPNIYRPLESVPLTTTGKMDRKTLRHIIGASTRQDLEKDLTPASPTVPPATELEMKLHQLFAEALHVEPTSFGINHSFIRLGGDSVTAMRLANRCSQMNYRLTMQDILQHQTVANLVSQLDRYSKDNAPSSTPAIEHLAPERSAQSVSESGIQDEFVKVLEASINATDPFTDRGVNSAKATQLVNRINGRFGTKITGEEILPIIAALAKRPESQVNEHLPIPRTPSTEPVVQSFAQRRLWFLDQLYPNSTWYLLPFAIRLRGHVNLSALEVALNAIVERHEPLRTTFKNNGGIEVQVVHPFRPERLKVVDMTLTKDQDIWNALQREQSTTFNLEDEPGWRPSVFHLGPEDHILSIVMHHIISDGWSVDILQKELNIFYTAANRGCSPLSQIDPLPTHYRDFSDWQRQQNDKDRSQLKFWVREIEGSRPAELLCDKPRPPMLSGEAGLQKLDIGGTLYKDLQLFCKAHGVTAHTVLLAAFRAAQYRLTGARDVILGTPFAGRQQPELEPLIGLFVNLQCIRTEIEHAHTTFYQLVRQVQAKMSLAFANNDLPFERIVSELMEERDLSRNPLVQLIFVFHSQSALGHFDIEGVKAERLTLSCTSRFDLEFHIYQGRECFQGEILFSLDLFHQETIKILHAVFIDILQHGLTQPATPIDLIPLKGASATLHDKGLLNLRKTDYPRGLSVIDLFEQQVKCCPNRMAVKDSSTELTYHELSSKSDQIALFLTDQSLAPESVIGVFANRGCETIVAFLGVLKANLAYLPLDVKSPVGRLETILSSAKTCKLVLLGSRIERPALGMADLHFIPIPDVLIQGNRDKLTIPHTSLNMMPSAESTAYIIFTSGSTGVPKGVMIQHRAIIRLARCTDIIKHHNDSRAIAHMSNIAFDISVWEIYTALLNGRTLICIDSMTVLDYRLLGHTFAQEGVQIAILTPAMLKQCLIESASTISQLDTLLVAGDCLDPSDAITARTLVKSELINAYGPTEDGVFSTVFKVPENGIFPNGIPIGRSISDSAAYVMDPSNQLAPVGVMGELVVAGDGLAQGYTQPELDQGRFITLAVGAKTVRGYRTGDIVRYRPGDGQLEYFGRIDLQVKIRGHRVELTEIDRSLLAFSFIKEAVSICRKEKALEPDLVSFVTIDEGQDWHAIMGGVRQDAIGRVEDWKELFETNVYDPSDLRPGELGRDFTGWKSMYTGAPIEREEMNEWLDDTISALLNGSSPGHVFEVGTGTGMMLFNLVEGLQSYVGLEPSTTALNFVQTAVPNIPGLKGKVRLLTGTADDINRIDRSNFVDVAVINSVAQYFPTPDYLLKVVEDLMCLQGAKRIFLGDIRSYALYEEFQVSQALYSRTQGLPTMADIRSQMAETVHMEEELLVDPAFFTSLPSRLPHLVEHVEILPKRMVATNELSCYRYAAVLYAKQQPNLGLRIHDVEESQWVDFSARKMNRESLLEHLQQRTTDTSVVAISNIPYSKICLERLIADQLKDRLVDRVGGPGWLAPLRETAKKFPSLAAIDLIDLAERTGFQVEISWARQYSQRGGLDAIFHRIEPVQKGARVLFRFPTDHQGRALDQLSNNPLQLSSNREMEKWMRKALQKTLPTYMVPRVVRVLERMPLNSNGKIDRKALASMVAVAASQNTVSTRVDPRDHLERALRDQFTKVLGRDIGVFESLFDHGGHSLTAVKLVNRINENLHTCTRASDVFECPTVAGLAARIRSWPGSITRPVASPFSLVGGNLAPATSSELVKIGLSPTEVADIVPVTNTQAWFLTRWAPVSMRLNLHGRIDINQWKTACHAVTQKHSTLRTLFTKLEGRFVQVVLRAVNVPFTHKLTGDTVSDEAHSGLSPVSTKLHTRFELVSQSLTDHTFTVRLSHAQYDGLSLPLLFSDLVSAYNGNLLSPPVAVPFSDYVYGCAYHQSPDSLSFWNDYLRGARLTTLSDTTLSGDDKAVDVKATVTGELPASLPGITFPTLVNAAFAFTLAEMVCSQDVTFGLVLNLRDLPINGVEAILGPCINICPVRVQSQQAWTVSDLCHNLHDSYTAVSRHGYVELPDIVANCTDWPRDSDFGCLINHFPPDRTPSFSLKDADVVDFSMDTRIDLTDQLLVRSIVGEGTWEVQVLTSSNLMSNEKASVLAERLLKTGQTFSQYPEVPLSSHLLR
ncbi:enniatin synthase [Aspergillus awamori]|uniref:Enniatin synthase n=1 Tax=Aspergillus awamori TaxID=105351 RepID=A0A401KLN3_ASPAW|nr:enniatin synthase [Aspergillus awamori]GKZ53834.1 nonribosomal peptide synthase [Aspergillus niger]